MSASLVNMKRKSCDGRATLLRSRCFHVSLAVVWLLTYRVTSSFFTLPLGRVGPKGRRGGSPSPDATRRFLWGTVG